MILSTNLPGPPLAIRVWRETPDLLDLRLPVGHGDVHLLCFPLRSHLPRIRRAGVRLTGQLPGVAGHHVPLWVTLK